MSLIRKQEVFLGEYCGFHTHKLNANMKEVTVVGQKYVLMSGVLGSLTKQRLERGLVSNTLIVPGPATISSRNPGFTGKWDLGNTILGPRGAYCYCIGYCFLGHHFYFSTRMFIFLIFYLIH